MDQTQLTNILLAVIGALLMVGVKLLIQLNNRVTDYGKTLAKQEIINANVKEALIEFKTLLQTR